jgi:zinc protease
MLRFVSLTFFRAIRRGGLAFALLANIAAAAPWPKVQSDLPPDPAVRWGTLPNGLRYAILPNAEPKDRVSLRLLVSVGSLHERDDERGLAHFIEHMAFRGTRAHPAGSIVATLQRLGMGLGPDNTAFTNYNYTIYHLELPDAQESTLREGLGVFREYADGITFDNDAIERERGVILSEKFTRNTPDYRAGQAGLEFLWPESLHAQRAAIGTESAVRSFRREKFVAFYDAWYRPERMAVIIVGNVSPEEAERLVAETFITLAPRGPAREEPAGLVPVAASDPDVGVFVDAGLVGVSLVLEHPRPFPHVPDTHAQRVAGVNEALAFSMLQLRLEQEAHEPGSPFLTPTASVTTSIPGWRVATMGVAGKIDRWRFAARELEQQHRRALFHGFSSRELAQARSVFQNALDQRVRSAATRHSEWLAGQLANSLLEGTVFTTPETLRRELAPVIAAATPADCLNAFRAAWTTGSPHVFIAANPVFKVSREELAAELNKSRGTRVKPAADTAELVFAYNDFGPPGRLVHHENISDLDVKLGEFANGVRINFKPTAFEADLVEMHVRIGVGRLALPENQPGLALLADAAFMGGGLVKHSSQDLKTILASHAIAISFQVGTDAFEFYARCSRRDLLLTLQVIAAYLKAPGYRPEALPEAQAWYNSMLASLAAAPGGAITMFAPRALLGGDRRFGVPNNREFYAVDLPALSGWLDYCLERAPIEIAVVGDLSWDDAVTATSRTLGALPARAARTNTTAESVVHFAPPPPNAQVYTAADKLRQAAIAWYFPMPDLADIHQERRCRLLAATIADRLRVSLREELGAAYAPVAEFTQTEGFPAFNYFLVYADVDASGVARAAEIIKREITALHSGSLTDDEFNRVHQPFVRLYDDSLRNNGYWCHTVLADAQQNPKRITAARDRAGDITSISRGEIEALAHRYLDPANGFLFVSEPPPVKAWGKK